MNKRTIYSGKHKGIAYEINYKEARTVAKTVDMPETWASYIYIDCVNIPEDQRESFWLKPEYDRSYAHYDYMSSLLANLPWHHGITYYDKEGGPDNKRQFIKAGCDYGHLWDEGHTYDPLYVENEIKNVIDAFWQLVPDYKLHCSGNGKYYHRSEGTFMKDGYFRSKEYQDKIEAERKAEANK